MEGLMGKGKAAGTMLRALVLAYLVTTVILLALAFIMLKFQPDTGKTEIGILVTYVLSCFLGGWYAGRKAERRKFLWGLMTGLLYFLLLFLISGMGDRAAQTNMVQSLLSLALCAGGGMLGGMIS